METLEASGPSLHHPPSVLPAPRCSKQDPDEYGTPPHTVIELYSTLRITLSR